MGKQRQVAERFHPGNYLSEELKERHVKPTIFALHCQELGLNGMAILSVLSEQRSINRVLATGIAEVLAHIDRRKCRQADIKIWLNLQKAYDDWEPNANT